jgi:DNA-binding transcriptional MerR regulator
MSESQVVTIPDKTYFTIGEVSKLCDVQETVLRYWQERFRQLNPVRRRGRRYYQRKDIELIQRIRDLLYVKGYTINGAKKVLSESQPTAKLVESVSVVESAPVAEQLQPIPVVPQEIPVPVAPAQPMRQEATAEPVAQSRQAQVGGLLADLESLLAEVK